MSAQTPSRCRGNKTLIVMIHRSTLLVLAYFAVLGFLPTAARAVRTPETSETVIAQTSTDTPANTQPLSSRDVLNLQLRLQTLGYYNQAVDGIYGDDTVDALKRFQEDEGLPVTGVVDRLTVDRLQNPQLITPRPSPEEGLEDSEAISNDTAVDSDIAQADEATADEADDTAEPTADESSTEGDNAQSDSADSAESAENRSSIRWLLWLVLAAVALASLGGGLIIATRSSHDDDDDTANDDALGSARSAEAAQVNPAQTEVTVKATEVPLDQDSPQHETNGHKPSSSKAQTAKTKVDSPVSQSTATNPPSQTTQRLPKLDVVETLIEDLQGSSPAKRKRAIWELGQRGSSVALQPLVNLLLDADSKERSLILAAVSEISARTLKPMNRALAIALQDPNPEVRKNAIRDITRVYDLTAQAAQVLAHVQTDSDPEVRATAQWALEQFNQLRTIAMGEGPAALSGHTAPPPDLLPEDSKKHQP